ncbi:MAG TPA: CBS domain-containing protein [Desulfobacteria bacterium]|nr:CBS domain-containing protein [Desulfobacteria bacterium]
MEIIVSHNNTDFDGLAAMIAAKKLYPEAELVYGGKLHSNVREFMALHKDTFAFRLAKDIPLKEVTRIILVDTKNPARIGEARTVLQNPGIDIHIFDHHPYSPDDISGDFTVVEQVGAATTILVEYMRDRNISINSFEATVLALGIYEDTGSLTFGTTTQRDAEAVAYLLATGAKLSVVAEYIDRPLSDRQKAMLNGLLHFADTFSAAGVKVLLSKGEFDEYIDGLALVVHKMMDIINPDVAVAVVKMEDRVHLVARSSDDIVDVSKILSRFNGGGHPSAASAVVRDGNIDQIADTVRELLKENIRPEVMGENIMTSPVKTISKEKSIDEAAKILLRYGHTGIPVVDNEMLIGIISRRDIEKAKHHGLGHAPVKGFMSRKVVTINRNTTISEIQTLMIERNIGRLPVVENGKIVGIVSRTDVLRTLHGENYPGRYEHVYNITYPIACVGDNVAEQLRKLPDKMRDLLGKISYLADNRGYRVYAVGGFVRDLMLGVENLDLDLVVEGDGPSFARILAEFLCGRVRIHEKFGTAMVISSGNIRVDVATARTEYYEYPAALPKIEESSLKHDLFRRDFSINAMAINLGAAAFGDVVDFFGGRKDLDEGIVRVLYNLSFVEDPTRILRAVRFEQRYGFKIESQTLELARNAIKTKMLAKLSADRVREELKHILGEASPLKSILRMDELGIWQYVLPEANLEPRTVEIVNKLPEAFKAVRDSDYGDINEWIVYLAVLVRASVHDISPVIERLKLTREESRILEEIFTHSEKAFEGLKRPGNMKMSEIASVVRYIPTEGYIYMMAAAENPSVTDRLRKYLTVAGNNKLHITGEDIKKLGFKPGPLFKKAMDAVRNARLDRAVTTREEELLYVKEFIQEEIERG